MFVQIQAQQQLIWLIDEREFHYMVLSFFTADIVSHDKSISFLLSEIFLSAIIQ